VPAVLHATGGVGVRHAAAHSADVRRRWWAAGVGVDGRGRAGDVGHRLAGGDGGGRTKVCLQGGCARRLAASHAPLPSSSPPSHPTLLYSATLIHQIRLPENLDEPADGPQKRGPLHQQRLVGLLPPPQLLWRDHVLVRSLAPSRPLITWGKKYICPSLVSVTTSFSCWFIFDAISLLHLLTLKKYTSFE
jgi:hypothetical protein